MARKNRSIHPSLLGGQPEHGDPWHEEAPLDATNEELGQDDEDDDDNEPEDRYTALSREVDALKQTNAALLRQLPPVEPRRPEPEPEDDTDWDNLIFTDPKAAVAKIKEQTKRETQAELRREYSQDQSTNKFWSDFYAAHKDLSEDGDLVELVLNSNLSKLADLPVKKAMDELADLTRKRIMRYSGAKGKPRSPRAVAEGASSPTNRRPAEEPKRPTTLGDVIRARKDVRRKAASAA